MERDSFACAMWKSLRISQQSVFVLFPYKREKETLVIEYSKLFSNKNFCRYTESYRAKRRDGIPQLRNALCSGRKEIRAFLLLFWSIAVTHCLWLSISWGNLLVLVSKPMKKQDWKRCEKKCIRFLEVQEREAYCHHCKNLSRRCAQHVDAPCDDKSRWKSS